MAFTFSHNKLLLGGAGGAAAVMLALAIVGAVRAYSPLPYWDMWDGYLNFFLAVGDGDLSAWWRQQNEHRIFLSHLLFWADLRWFGGAGAFLIVCNYLLLGAVLLLFWRMLRARLGPAAGGTPLVLLGLLMTAWLCSWMQEENLTWAFQSQFILAQLLPLAALYALHLSTGHAGQRYFVLACVAGLAAVGSMANGILALPMLLVYAALSRQGWRRCLVLAGLTLVAMAAFFYGYQRPTEHPSSLAVMLQSPGAVLAYVLRYLGSPFYFLSGRAKLGNALALLAGAAAILAAVWQALRWLRKDRDNLALALLLFIAYIGATALGTATGRLYLGAGQVFASRYTTPALMLWAALLLLGAPSLLRAARRPRWRLFAAPPLALLVAALVGLQLHALDRRDEQVYQKKIAGLALELGVVDQPQVLNVYPSAVVVRAVAERAHAQGLTIFGLAPWRGLRAALGQPVAPARSAPACRGSVDEVAPTDGDARFLRISGWLFDPAWAPAPAVLQLVDQHGRLAGVALSGRARPDVAAAIGAPARDTGFQGYVLAEYAGASLTLQGVTAAASCTLAAPIPALPINLVSATPQPDGTVSAAALLPGNQWLGGDFDRSALPGMKIYGSYLHADSDTGALSLRVKRGERVFYRSGPRAGRQMLEFPGSGLSPVALPSRSSWSALIFSGTALPAGEFTVTLRDAGDGWGEWSAIAVAP